MTCCRLIIWLLLEVLCFFSSSPRLKSVLHWTCAPAPLQSASHYAKRLHRWDTSIATADTHEHCDWTDVCVMVKKYILDASVEKVFALCVCVCVRAHLQMHTHVHANTPSVHPLWLFTRMGKLHLLVLLCCAFLPFFQSLLRQPNTPMHKAPIVREARRARWGSGVSGYLDAPAV